ncbi:MAG: RIP metalloprotease RseP [Treponema sp.]|jgi:regulator of sigma E protease|nr:RIP metalloprotease RseP [Treponema sp.]
MIIVKILLGLLGLGIVVFVHELGHFLAARLVGIEVEAFSIGWGKPFLRKKLGAVEYRLGVFPLGGYCKMKGENEFREAWENRQNQVEPVPGSFFAARPWRRIIVSFAGPFFNLVFAALVLSCIWGIGFTITTPENRIVLASEVDRGERYPADDAGLATGDRVISINGKSISTYQEIQQEIALHPEEPLALVVERDGQTLPLSTTPALDKSSGAGRIGVYYWAEPVVDEVLPEGPAALAGLESGDLIRAVNGEEVPYTAALIPLLKRGNDAPEPPAPLPIVYERAGQLRETAIVPRYDEAGNADLGLGWKLTAVRSPRYSLPGALAKGAAETGRFFAVSLKGLGLLFRGVDLTKAVSGPVRITYMVGDAAAAGFGRSAGTGFGVLANFLALISISLCIMNLLPLPILDGGMILLFLIEMLIRRPLHPRFIAVFQTAGIVLIAALMLFALFGDILYLSQG